MTQSLHINGKQYVPSNVLASQCGYSHDYIGKLAREEKILGTQVGRQWFIEPESLKTFLAQIEIQKKIRKEELSRRRKIEHESHQKKATAGHQSTPEFLAAAQTLVLLICGGLVGTLSWVAVHDGIGVSDLSYGATHNIAVIADATLPEHVYRAPGIEVGLSASSVESQVIFEEQSVFTTLPQFPPRNVSYPIAVQTEVIASEFSDEVQIVVDDSGDLLIRPMFKEEAGSTTFLMVPVEKGYE